MPTNRPDQYQHDRVVAVAALESEIIKRDLTHLSDALEDQHICSRCHVLFGSETALFHHLREDHDLVELDEVEGRCDQLARQEQVMDDVMRRVLGRDDDTRYREAGLVLAEEDLALSVSIERDDCLENSDEN